MRAASSSRMTPSSTCGVVCAFGRVGGRRGRQRGAAFHVHAATSPPSTRPKTPAAVTDGGPEEGVLALRAPRDLGAGGAGPSLALVCTGAWAGTSLTRTGGERDPAAERARRPWIRRRKERKGRGSLANRGADGACRPAARGRGSEDAGRDSGPEKRWS